nr:hypothetical protein [Tanacetum cinerariifolium]
MDVYISEEYMVKRRMEKKLAVARAKGTGVSSNACKSDKNGEKMNKKGHSSSPFIKIRDYGFTETSVFNFCFSP